MLQGNMAGPKMSAFVICQNIVAYVYSYFLFRQLYSRGRLYGTSDGTQRNVSTQTCLAVLSPARSFIFYQSLYLGLAVYMFSLGAPEGFCQGKHLLQSEQN